MSDIETTNENKNAWVYWFLFVLFGLLGIHKFYLNKNGLGILYLLTGGILGMGLIYDWLYPIFALVRDNRGRVISGAQSLRTVNLSLIGLVVLVLIISVIINA